MSLTHVYLSSNRYRQTLTNEAGAAVIGATVTLTLRNGVLSTSPNVTGVTWPQTMTGNGDGTYDYTPPAAAVILFGRTYLAVTDASLGGVLAHNEVQVICQRDST